MRLGRVLSTARASTRSSRRGAQLSTRSSSSAIASRDLARAEAQARRARDRAGARLLRGAARRPRGRRGLHLAAELAACGVVDPRARGGQARAVREAADARRAARSSARSTRPSAPAACWRRRSCGATTRRPGACGLLRAARSASCGSCARPSRSRSRDPGDVRLSARARRRRPDGRGLLLRERPAPARGRAGPGQRRQVTAATAWTCASRPRCASPATCSARFDCGIDMRRRAELEVVGTEGSLLLGDPWHSREPVIEVRRGRRLGGGGPRRATTRMPASSRPRRGRRGRAASRCSGATTRSGQARTIEALYESASSGRSVRL